MPQLIFSTLSVRLLEFAEATARYFQNHGYRVYAEKRELAFPYTPTLLCKRQSTTIIIEVTNSIRLDRIASWVGFARSCNHDTRFAISLPSKIFLTPEIEDNLRKDGVGLYTAIVTGVTERIPPKDLAINVELPPLNSLPRKLRTLLGPAYEQFNRSQWREGFEDACQALEVEARRYLKAGLKAGRIIVMGSQGPRNLTSQQIDRMTIGQLANTFSNIQNQNYLDAQVNQALSLVNADRVGVVHHKAKMKTEKRLRANVGQNFWAIIGVLREIVKQ